MHTAPNLSMAGSVYESLNKLIIDNLVVVLLLLIRGSVPRIFEF